MAGVVAPVDDFPEIIPDTSERNMLPGLPVSNLTAHKWHLLIAAVAAYQHNAQYQAIHLKLLVQQERVQIDLRSIRL